MPARTGKQYRLMQLCAHNPGHPSCKGISQAVAKEFIEKTSPAARSRWSKGKKRKKPSAKQLRRAANRAKKRGR